jgi:hypothetical protein
VINGGGSFTFFFCPAGEKVTNQATHARRLTTHAPFRVFKTKKKARYFFLMLQLLMLSMTNSALALNISFTGEHRSKDDTYDDDQSYRQADDNQYLFLHGRKPKFHEKKMKKKKQKQIIRISIRTVTEWRNH